MRCDPARSEGTGYALILITGILWGFIGVFIKVLDSLGAQALQIAFLRVLFSFALMFVLCLLRRGRAPLRLDRKTLLACALLGLVCHGIYNIFYSAAVTLAGMAVSAVLLDIAPAVTLLLSLLLFGERMTIWKGVAVAVNIFGCVLAATNGEFAGLGGSAVGLLCGVGAGLCYAMTAVLGKMAADRTDPFLMSMYSYLFAAIFLALPVLPQAGEMCWSAGILLWSLGFAAIPTALAYVLYYLGLQYITENSRVPVLASMEVVVAAVLGILLYRELITAAGAAGIVLVIVSVAMMNRRTAAKEA